MSEENNLVGNEPRNTPVVNETVVSGSDTPQQTQAPAVFDFGKMVGTGGALSDNWREGLPENIRGEKCLDSIKTIGTLAQSYVHAQKAMGQNKVALPGENSSPEEWDAFYKATGRPDAEDGYTHDKVELPEGIVLDDAQVAQFRKFAFEHGMNQKTFEAALAFDVQRLQAQQAAALEAHNAEYDQTVSALKQEYGANFSRAVAQCEKTLDTFGLRDMIKEKGLGNNYSFIKAMITIGERISESRLKGGEAAADPADPTVRYNEIVQNPDDPFFKHDHPAHASRVEEVNRLLKQISLRSKV